MVLFFIVGIIIIFVGLCLFNDTGKKAGTGVKKGHFNSNSQAYSTIVFGIFCCVLTYISILIRGTKMASALSVGSYSVALAFMAIGWFGGIIKGRKIKEDIKNFTIVQGTIVDFKTRTHTSDSIYRKSFWPIYEYTHIGQVKTINASFGSSDKKYCCLGRQVTIVINDATGETYCLEELKDKAAGCIKVGIVGIVIFALTIIIDIL